MRKSTQKRKEPFDENTEFVLGPNANEGHRYFYWGLGKITLKRLQQYRPESGWCKGDIEKRLEDGVFIYAKKING